MTEMERTEPAVEAMSTDDGALVREALGGDGAAYEELYLRHRDRTARAAYLLVEDPHLAQDIAQEAFLTGWRRLGRLRDPALFGAWVTGIAVNLCRRKALRRVLAERSLDERPVVAAGGTAHLAVMVRDAVASLPARMRTVAVMRFYGEYTEAEIAEVLGIPIGTVKSRVSRARSKLTEVLGPLLEEA